MGGKKKLGLKQMEQMQGKKDTEEEKKKKEKAGPPKEKRAAGIILPDVKGDKVLGELKKMSVLTPYSVASRFNIKMSVAKDLLRQLEGNGKVQIVSGSHNIKVYKALD